MKAPISCASISTYHLRSFRRHSNDPHVQKEPKLRNEVSEAFTDRRADSRWRLVDTARPSSPSEQGQREYRRAGGYDKQGDAGAGSSRPEYVSDGDRCSRGARSEFYCSSVVDSVVAVPPTRVPAVLVPVNNREKEWISKNSLVIFIALFL